MMDIPKISVIVPVYNAGNYIEQCVRSLFGQTLSEIEYIFIDDAGSDDSMEIVRKTLEEYPHRKDWVKFIVHEKNQGVSTSRSDGLKAAMGEYITHCDADDWLETDAYGRLYEFAKSEDSDIVVFNYLDSYANREVKRNDSPVCSDLRTVVMQICGLQKPLMTTALWNKIIRRDVAKPVTFDSRLSYGEDAVYLLNILKDDKRISYLTDHLYHYRKDSANSLVKQLNEKAFNNDLILFKQLLAIESSDLIFNKAKKSLIGFFLQLRIFRYSFPDKKRRIIEMRGFGKFVFYNKNLSTVKSLLLNSGLYIYWPLFDSAYKFLKDRLK